MVPDSAYVVMFRASSEMAVAIIVTSVSEKPRSWASWCPACRAVTMSSRCATSTTMSSDTVASDRLPLCELAVQQRKPLLQIQGGVHVVEREAQLDHRTGNLGLDTDDHRLRAAQPGH